MPQTDRRLLRRLAANADQATCAWQPGVLHRRRGPKTPDAHTKAGVRRDGSNGPGGSAVGHRSVAGSAVVRTLYAIDPINGLKRWACLDSNQGASDYESKALATGHYP